MQCNNLICLFFKNSNLCTAELNTQFYMCKFVSHRFGPLRHQWCMRLEGKNAHIKQLVGKNFKNLPKSVANRHQRYMCLQLLCPPGVKSTNYLYSGDEIKQGKIKTWDCTHTYSNSYLLIQSLNDQFRVFIQLELKKLCSKHFQDVRNFLCK